MKHLEERQKEQVRMGRAGAETGRTEEKPQGITEFRKPRNENPEKTHKELNIHNMAHTIMYLPPQTQNNKYSESCFVAVVAAILFRYNFMGRAEMSIICDQNAPSSSR